MDWEIYDGQRQRGPMPDAGVHDAIRSGLPRNAYVRQAGTSDWMPLETHPVFAAELHHRGAPVPWAPPPPPPPAYVGAAVPVAPIVTGPPPGTPYAVSSPHAGKPTRRKLVGRGLLVQGLGLVVLLGAGYAFYGGLVLMVEAAGLASLGLVLLLLGALLNLKWACGLCKAPIADRSLPVCPSCRASFT
jgi:hypothetical protein